MVIRRTRDGVFECPSVPPHHNETKENEVNDDGVDQATPKADECNDEFDPELIALQAMISFSIANEEKEPQGRGRRKNATASYLEGRIMSTGGMNGTFVNKIRAAINKKLPVSRTIGMTEDHVQNFFTKMIHRDSLAKDIANGYKIRDGELVLFAIRSGYTDIRDTSVDPVCRELFGSRNQKDRKSGESIGPIRDSRVVWSPQDDGYQTWADIADTSANQEDSAIFNQLWNKLEDTIREYKPNAAERYINILQCKVMGDTVGEIAEKENVSVFRAASMMAEVRRVLRCGDLGDMLGVEDY